MRLSLTCGRRRRCCSAVPGCDAVISRSGQLLNGKDVRRCPSRFDVSLSLSLRGVVGTKSDEIRERRLVGVVGVGASGPSSADGRRSCGSFDVIRRSLGRSVRKWRPEKSQLLTLTFRGLSGGRRHLGTSGFGILNRFDSRFTVITSRRLSNGFWLSNGFVGFC